tara:strand:- start:712 stop:1386 length:675 start_codon:yes stop_codon:yes gene_type:complete
MKDSVNLRLNQILEACKDKSVLHLGCTNSPYTLNSIKEGTILHSKIELVAKELYGIDLDPEGVQIMLKAGFKNIAVANLEEKNNPFKEKDYDVIVAGEIIEHLSNPGQFLDNIKPLLSKPNAKLIITTVNAFYALRIFTGLFSGNESVHPDHVSYYSKRTLTRLLDMHGYKTEEFSYYSISDEYKKTLKESSWKSWLLDRFATRFLPPLFSDGLVFHAVKKVNI